MTDNEIVEIGTIDDNWKTKVLVIGGAVGLLTGLGAAYLMIQRSDESEEKPVLNLVEAIKLGLLVFGLLRQVSQLGEGK